MKVLDRPVYSQFSVTSGGLCYGELNNLWRGALSPTHGFPTGRAQSSGTVMAQDMEFNLAATNGKWNAFQLLDDHDRVVGWFAAHIDVDVDSEIDKILTLAGSPYEEDHGDQFNTDKTAANGVFVINRYDWGYYDRRGHDIWPTGNDEEVVFQPGIAVGLVDSQQAKDIVQLWKAEAADAKTQPAGGVWMQTTIGEYMFGRFGFDDEHAMARSFLLFSSETVFTRTVFAGKKNTLRRYMSDEERFEKKLSEGCTFDGLEELHQRVEWRDDIKCPDASACLGPFTSEAYLLRVEDLDALRIKAGAGEIAQPLNSSILSLMNEMILAYIEKFVASNSSAEKTHSNSDSLFGDPTTHNALDRVLLKRFTHPEAFPVPNLDFKSMEYRMRRFLTSYDIHDRFYEDEFVAGMCQVVATMAVETLELGGRHLALSSHSKLVPLDVRFGVYEDLELLSKLGFSKVFWYGDGP